MLLTRRVTAEPKRPDIDWTAQAKERACGPLAGAGRIELARLLGVTADALEALNVGVGFDRAFFWSFPERSADGKVTGIVRRYRDGSKKTMRYSKHGLYFAADWWVGRGPVFLPEGGSDTAAMIDMQLNAIGRPSCLGGLGHLADILRPWEGDGIIVVGEHDCHPERRGVLAACPADCKGCGICWPGAAGARDTALRLSRRLRREVLWCLPPDGAKDARSWANHYHAPEWGKELGLVWRERIDVLSLRGAR